MTMGCKNEEKENFAIQSKLIFISNNMDNKNQEQEKNAFSLMEEEVLKFWEDNKIFEKSVEKEAPKGDYVFYDGPPFATGTPHYGHIVASVMKDAVPRYWTMNGYRVERRWGWDCHGLPIENIVEKEIGSESKKYIEEEIGVEKFNEMCKSKVLSYVDDWKKVVRKVGRWADMENPYKTMDLEYMESVWWAFKKLYDNGLVYKGYRSMHVCPRCETTLSQSEVAEGYKDIKDLSCIAKFELLDEGEVRGPTPNGVGVGPLTGKIYVLAWTTTPWTLIGNVALAVGEDIDYVEIEEVPSAQINSEDNKGNYEVPSNSKYVVAKEIFVKEDNKSVPYNDGSQAYKYGGRNYRIIKTFKGSELVGKAYKPLFDYYANDEKLENRENGWKIYTAPFVTTEEGTGVVHIAPAFGEDDLNLGKEHKLPFVQHLGMDGNFKEEVKDFKGLNVKPKEDTQATDIEVIKYLAHNDLLFSKEKYEHSYPHCWRCDTPLLNYATSSWFVAIEKIKKELLENAKDINWSPEHIKKGRWGNWLEGARDWSISRQRFWASVMPIWECECGERKVIGSVKELEELSGEKIDDLHKHTVDKITFKCEKCEGKMKRIPDVLDTWFDSGSMPYAQAHYPFENKEKFEKSFPAQFIAEGADQCRCWFYYMHSIAVGAKQSRAFNNVIVNGIVLAEDGKKMSKKLQNYPDPTEVLDTYGADALRQYLLNAPVMLADNLCFSENGVKEAKRKNIMILWNVVKFYEMFKKGDESGEPNSKNVLDKWILARLNQLIATVTENMEKYNLPNATRPITEFIDDLSTWYIRRSRDRFKGTDEDDKKSALAITRFVLLELSKVMAPFMPFIAEQVWQKITGNEFKDSEKSVHLEGWAEKQEFDKKIIKEMSQTRKIVEMGLAKRDEANMKIRQPLNQLKIKNAKLDIDNYVDLIKDELNIKNVSLEIGEGDLELELDIELTPELIQEGLKREFVRTVNMMRKNEKMTIEDRIKVYWSGGEKTEEMINKYKEELLSDVLALDIVKKENNGKEVKINNELIKIEIEKS